jgi:hypothetical protein
MELQWGERCRAAFGTHACIAGLFSISVWSVLLPSGLPLVLAVCGRLITNGSILDIRGTWGRAGVASLSIGVMLVRRGELVGNCFATRGQSIPTWHHFGCQVGKE